MAEWSQEAWRAALKVVEGGPWTEADRDALAAKLSPVTASVATLGEPAAMAGLWRKLTAGGLLDEAPFELQLAVHQRIFDAWPEDRLGPAPYWCPNACDLAETNVVQAYGNVPFADVHAESVEQPEVFWPKMLERLRIISSTPPTRMLDTEKGAAHAKWLPGMRGNIVRSILCPAGASTDDAPAVIVGGPGSAVRSVTLAQLKTDVARVAAALRVRGVEPGHPIAIAMPMTYWSVPIYLGIVSIGAVVVSIADSFAADEIATRLRIAGATAIVTQDIIVRGEKRHALFERVLAANAPPAIVIPAEGDRVAGLREQDQLFEDFLAGGSGGDDSIEDGAMGRTSNILFSSGTTGDPKAICWSHITPIKAATDGWGHQDIRRGDVVCWPTNLGWMMGPWLIYATLLNGGTIALYEGSPTGAAFAKFVQDAKVTMLGLVPSLVKAWRAANVTAGLSWSTIRCFSSTGEASTAVDMLWLSSRARYRPVVEYCGGTEIGGGYIAGSVSQPQVAAAFSTPALGSSFLIIDDAGQPIEQGELALRPPLLGSSDRLLNRDHDAVYYRNMPLAPDGRPLRRHGDHMEQLAGGYYRAHGRTDDTMNLGGIKTSSADIERVLNRISGVLETAAIGMTPAEGGPSLLVVFVVPSADGEVVPALLKREFQVAIRSSLNPLFKVHEIVVVAALPRTASNKVMRRVLRQQYRDGSVIGMRA